LEVIFKSHLTNFEILSIEKHWNLTANPRILTTFDNSTTEEDPRTYYKKFLELNVGVEYGGWFLFK
jgi:hypothetical protein